MLEHRIRDRIDIYGVRKSVKTLASELGFGRRACEELAIVVSELGSNIVKYGVHGSIRMAALGAGETGLVMVARDFGRPFHDLKMAVRDGYDDRGPIDPLALQVDAAVHDHPRSLPRRPPTGRHLTPRPSRVTHQCHGG